MLVAGDYKPDRWLAADVQSTLTLLTLIAQCAALADPLNVFITYTPSFDQYQNNVNLIH
jgi:hypothetical protein